MFPLGWTVWCLVLCAPLTLGTLDITEADSGVTCPQHLNCSMKNGSPLDVNSVKVTDLKAQVKLCCRDPPCALCLFIQVGLDLDTPGEEEEGNSGQTDDQDEETKDDKETGSVTVCYKTPEMMVPPCKKVEFPVNQARPPQQSTAQMSMVITKAVISYDSVISIHSPNVKDNFKIHVPWTSYKECFSDSTYVQGCKVPKLKFRMNKADVELQYQGDNSSVPVVCLQNETDGICKMWDRRPIPLESLTTCTCFQAWKENGQRIVHSRVCPFKNRSSLWKTYTVSVEPGDMNNSPMLWWTVSAPCRLQGEVWACERTPGLSVCSERQGFRQKLGNEGWLQNITGLWESHGVFEKINLQNSPCVMVKIGELERGPFCYNNINRWRWSLFAVVVILLLSLTLLITFCLRDFIKKSVSRWHHCGFHKEVYKAHVLVLSPPDSDVEVSAEVSELGSLLWSESGLLSVKVDQWSRKEQLSWGPLPWSHCQLLDMKSPRVVLVLTPKAVDRAQTWSSQDSPELGLQEDSPYSHVFWASLFAIQAHKKQGRASDRFVLVTFESLWTDTKIIHSKLPQILQGLPLFHFPSQTKELLSALCVKKDLETIRQRKVDLL